MYLNVIKQPRNKPAPIWSIILTKETRIYNVYCKEMVKTTSSIRHAGKTGETHAKKKKKLNQLLILYTKIKSMWIKRLKFKTRNHNTPRIKHRL